jgi:hypothetical protein
MKVLLIILGILLLIGMIPVGVMVHYHGEVELKLVLAFFRIKLMPKKPKTRKQLAKEAAKKEKKAAQKKEKKKKQQAQSLIAKPPEPPKPKKPLKDTVAGLVPFAKLGVRFVGEFFHKRLCIRRLKIRAVLAGGNPAKLALNNGKAWEAIGTALPILERGFRIKERKIVVYPDFTASKTDLEAEVYIRLRIGGVVLMLFRYGFRAIKILIASKRAAKKNKKAQEAAAKSTASNSEPENNTEKVVSA